MKTREYKKAYIIEHASTESFTSIAGVLGMSRNTVASIAKQAGIKGVRAKSGRKGRKWSEEEINEMQRTFPTTSNEELAKRFKCTFGELFYLQKKLCLLKDKDYMRKTQARVARSLNTDEDVVRRRSDSLRKAFKRERMRLSYGLSPTMRRALATESKKMRGRINAARCYCKSLGYIVPPMMSKDIQYNEETRRSPRLEESAARHYGFTFRHVFEKPHEVVARQEAAEINYITQS